MIVFFNQDNFLLYEKFIRLRTGQVSPCDEMTLQCNIFPLAAVPKKTFPLFMEIQ